MTAAVRELEDGEDEEEDEEEAATVPGRQTVRFSDGDFMNGLLNLILYLLLKCK